MKQLILLFVSISIALSSHAQSVSIPKPPAQPLDQRAWNNMMDKMRQNSTYRDIEASYVDIKGSPYVYDDFVSGSLIMNNGAPYETVKLNYDGYQRGIVAMGDDGDKIILDGKYYVSALLLVDGDSIRYQKVNPHEPNTLYEVLYLLDDAIIYKDERRYIQDGISNGITNTPNRFASRSKYYIISGDEAPRPIKLKKKDLLKALPTKDAMLAKELISSRKLKVKKEGDFRNLFRMMAKSERID